MKTSLDVGNIMTTLLGAVSSELDKARDCGLDGTKNAVERLIIKAEDDVMGGLHKGCQETVRTAIMVLNDMETIAEMAYDCDEIGYVLAKVATLKALVVGLRSNLEDTWEAK